MASRILWVPIALFTVWSLIAHRWYVCHLKRACDAQSVLAATTTVDTGVDPAAVLTPPPPAVEPVVALESAAESVDNRPLVFNWNKPTALVRPGFADLRSTLIKALPEGQLFEITGLYYPGESAPTGFANMGLARAAQVRALFIPPLAASEPLAPHQIIESARLVATTPEGARDGEPFVGVDFGVRAPPPASEPREPEIKQSASDQRVEILFPLASDIAKSDPALDEFLDRLAERIQASGATVTVVGHTDSSGTPEFNLKLGMERAQHVRDLLIARGVPPNRVRARSEGGVSPVAGNDTEAGRIRNRRVEILFEGDV